MPEHASSGTEGKALSSVERRAHILESRDSGKVIRMDNSRQMAEAGKQVRHSSSVRKMRNGKRAVQFSIKKQVTATSCDSTVMWPHRQVGSGSRGEHQTWLCTALEHLCCCNPHGPAASQKYPLLQDSWLLPGAGYSWQSWHGCGHTWPG